MIADSRIGRSHTCPGVDNDRGFGGTCFPKDLNSLVVQMESKGVNASMLREVWKYNEKIRKVIGLTCNMKVLVTGHRGFIGSMLC